MKPFISIILFLLSLPVFSQPIDLLEHRVWNKEPIHIVLPVGKERRIDFPLSIELQVPASVQAMSERIQITESGSVYWIASKSFKKQRVNAITDTGYSYILDIEARPKAHQHPIAIVDDRIPEQESKTGQSPGVKYNYDYVDLTRFAAQSVYAPDRLIKPLPGIRRVAVEPEHLPLVKGADLLTEPMAQWVVPTIPSLYVTAVRVTSNSLKTITLDPRLLRGDFLAASSQHTKVNAAGEEGDTTTWYLVSDQPFDEVSP
ncbi:MAG: TIGR03749 family integrating conjugative element protein [Gammaproteobacteria bacterium]|jgi:integrating conjugative element protein (TIGR03749 family)|nr:TIGR03749 family integrating conjugative element protein [Gammaproteobacteria bacterium]